ncbi:hypothetical protein Btru_015624 [Bulinus truncatus]|nr:hypothetical protein Btru_015624 [Bulinus truncatus]
MGWPRIKEYKTRSGVTLLAQTSTIIMVEGAILDEGAIIDEVFLALGWWGRYQKIQLLMSTIPMLATGVHMLSIVFIGRFISHRCASIDNLNVSVQIGNQLVPFDVIAQNTWDNVTVTYESCSVEVKNGTAHLWTKKCLNGYNYSEPTDRSIVSQWDLVCDGESLSDVTQTVLLFGNLAGSLICTGLADVYGRKPTYIASHFLMFFTAIAICFSPNYTVFVVLRFIIGFGLQGAGMISEIILVELFPTKRRAVPSQIGCYFWPGALLVLSLISYLTKDLSWRYTSLIYAGMSIYVLAQWWIMDESPRWLLANNRIQEVERIIKKASRMNNVDPQKALDILRGNTLLSHNGPTPLDILNKSNVSENSLIEISGTQDKPVDRSKDNVRLRAFCTNRNVIFITVCFCYMWFTDNLTYYGLTMTSTSLTDNFYLGFILNILAELPAALAFGVLINRLGRKNCITIFHITGAVGLISSVLFTYVDLGVGLSAKTWLTVVGNLIGKLSLTAGYWCLHQYTPELYPTNLRNTGLGFASFAASVSGLIAPHFRTLERHVPWGPGVIFTCLCLLVPVIVRFLPETHSHELPQTINDMDKWIEKSGRKTKK